MSNVAIYFFELTDAGGEEHGEKKWGNADKPPRELDELGEGRGWPERLGDGEGEEAEKNEQWKMNNEQWEIGD